MNPFSGTPVNNSSWKRSFLIVSPQTNSSWHHFSAAQNFYGNNTLTFILSVNISETSSAVNNGDQDFFFPFHIMNRQYITRPCDEQYDVQHCTNSKSILWNINLIHTNRTTIITFISHYHWILIFNFSSINKTDIKQPHNSISSLTRKNLLCAKFTILRYWYH